MLNGHQNVFILIKLDNLSLIHVRSSRLHAKCDLHDNHLASCIFFAGPVVEARSGENVDSMLVQRRWRWANIETASGQILAFASLHIGVVYTHPSPTIIFSPADQGTFSKTAGQSQAYYNT